MLLALTEIYRVAAQSEEERCSKDVLRLHLQTLKFVINYTKVFKSCQSVSERNMFDAVYHNVVNHLPELYRIVSLKSVSRERLQGLDENLRYITNSVTCFNRRFHSDRAIETVVNQAIIKQYQNLFCFFSRKNHYKKIFCHLDVL